MENPDIQTNESKKNALIVDVGSFETIIGRSDSDNIELREPTVYTSTEYSLMPKNILSGLSEMAKEILFGNEALKFKNCLAIHNMIKEENYSIFVKFLRELIERLYIDPKDYSLVLILPPTFTNVAKEELKRLIFAELHFIKMTFMTPAVCVLTALGLDTGVVVDIGEDSTRIEGIFKGFPNVECLRDMPIGGKTITKQLSKLVSARLNYPSGISLNWVMELIKHQAVRCEMDPGEIISQILRGETNYDQLVEMPDGKNITLNRELFECVELFFSPELANIFTDDLITLIEQSIRSWERIQVPELVQKICFVGQTLNIPNLEKKIILLLKNKFPAALNVNAISLPNRKEIVWQGAKKLYNKVQDRLEWRVN